MCTAKLITLANAYKLETVFRMLCPVPCALRPAVYPAAFPVPCALQYTLPHSLCPAPCLAVCSQLLLVTLIFCETSFTESSISLAFSLARSWISFVVSSITSSKLGFNGGGRVGGCARAWVRGCVGERVRECAGGWRRTHNEIGLVENTHYEIGQVGQKTTTQQLHEGNKTPKITD